MHGQNLVLVTHERQGIVLIEPVGATSGSDMLIAGIYCKARCKALIYLFDLALHDANATIKMFKDSDFSCAWRSGRSGGLIVSGLRGDAPGAHHSPFVE